MTDKQIKIIKYAIVEIDSDLFYFEFGIRHDSFTINCPEAYKKLYDYLKEHIPEAIELLENGEINCIEVCPERSID